MWYFLKASLYDILDEYAPLKSKFSRRPTLWMTPELLKAIKEKNKAKRRAAKTTSAVDTALYKTFKNKLKTAIHEAKLHYLTVLWKKSKSNPYLCSKLWKSVNDIIGKSKSHQDSISTNISLDTINDFFCNVAVSADHETADQYLSSASVSSSSFHFTTIHPDIVLQMLQHLDIWKSTGPDGISARFLREVAAEITEPLTYLYNFSLQSGLIPSDWKQSNVTAVYKQGPCDDPSNYRPIYVVPIIAKVLEKLVASQLNSYCEENQLLSPYQGAYRCGRSTEQTLLFAIDTIVNALDSRKVVCAAFLDLRKAFDSLDHVVLLEHFSAIGVMGNELLWFTDYLSQGVQRIKVRDRVSSWSAVKGGVPQGSALGPLLFLIYVNAMPSLVKYGRLL